MKTRAAVSIAMGIFAGLLTLCLGWSTLAVCLMAFCTSCIVAVLMSIE